MWGMSEAGRVILARSRRASTRRPRTSYNRKTTHSTRIGRSDGRKDGAKTMGRCFGKAERLFL